MRLICKQPVGKYSLVKPHLITVINKIISNQTSCSVHPLGAKGKLEKPKVPP